MNPHCTIQRIRFKAGQAPHTGEFVKHYVPAASGRGFTFYGYFKLVGPGEYRRISALEYVRALR